jgi:cytochrome c
MKQLLMGIAAAWMLMSTPAFAAGDHGSADEAVAMVKKAQAFLKANGSEKAIAEFNKPKSAFRDRDLYVFYMDMNGKMIAHANPKMIGKTILELKDTTDGHTFIRSIVDGAKTKGSGWVDYHWPNPTTQQMELKSTYYEKAGNMILACGIYKGK